MHSMSRSKKGQFFLLSTISLIVVLFSLMRIFSPKNVVSSTDIVLRNEFFIFNNIVDKTIKTIDLSKDCEELKFNLEEFKRLIEKTYDFYEIYFIYKIESCDSSKANISLEISLISPNVNTQTKFNRIKNW